MKEFFSTVISLIIGIVVGLSPIKKEKVDKTYTPGEYYATNQEDEPDYRKLYNMYSGSSFEAIAECDKGSKKYPAGMYPYQPEDCYYWFWLMDKSVEVGERKEIITSYLLGPEDEALLGGGWYLYETDSKVSLISIANSKLESTTPITENPYPADNYTKGVYLSYVITDKQDNIAYKITYGTMLRWWCCMDKDEKGDATTDDAGGPRFGHTCSFSSNDTFTSGFIVGESGQTGIPATERSENKSYVMVKIEKCNLDDKGNPNDNWTVTSVEDLYKL